MSGFCSRHKDFVSDCNICNPASLTPEDKLKQFLEDSMADDAYIRNALVGKGILTEAQVFGDSYAVPSIVDIFDMLIGKLEK